MYYGEAILHMWRKLFNGPDTLKITTPFHDGSLERLRQSADAFASEECGFQIDTSAGKWLQAATEYLQSGRRPVKEWELHLEKLVPLAAAARLEGRSYD